MLKVATSPPIEPPQARLAEMVFASVAGLFFFVAILKFGDPVILDNLIQPPADASEALFDTWPIKWGYRLMVPLVLTGLISIPWKTLRFKPLLLAPLLWLGWQFVSATQTISRTPTVLTLEHFSACVALFYVGYFALQGSRNPWPLWAGMALALCWIMRLGVEQHFGGLEATRQFIESMKNDPAIAERLLHDPAYVRRIASSRIFATFSNPDALAGAIELLLPLTLLFLWQLTPKVRPPIRWLFVAILGGCGLACLYWTGSKGGWLVALLMGVIVLWRSTFSLRVKWTLICILIIVGAVALGWRYASSYKKQQVSVGTRVAYWKGGLEIAARHPMLGTGPGTFSVAYAQINSQSDDFARLCHNDYLQQASDSGFPGFLAFLAFIGGNLVLIHRFSLKKSQKLNFPFVTWLGVLGICLHSAVDYHLYVPALAWPMFFLLGFAANSYL